VANVDAWQANGRIIAVELSLRAVIAPLRTTFIELTNPGGSMRRRRQTAAQEDPFLSRDRTAKLLKELRRVQKDARMLRARINDADRENRVRAGNRTSLDRIPRKRR
jgi:hypothetical protein